MSILCRIIGHEMYFDGVGVTGPSTCKRCGHREPGTERGECGAPMPKVKPYKCPSCTNGYNGTNGNGYQPCGCVKP